MLFKVIEEENHIIYRIFGLKLKFRKIRNNKIFIVDKQGKKHRVPFIWGLKVDFAGENSTIVLHSPVIKFKNSQIFLRSNCTVEIGASKKSAKKLLVLAFDNNLSLKIGDNFSCTNDCQFLFSRERDKKIVVGNNCMFASNVIIRTSDGHTIVDKSTGEVLNYGEDVIIKDNVWLAMNTTVLKGVTIEEGCVIGTGSLVTKSCDEPNSIYAGVPARKIKSNIAWDREAIPDYLEQNRK